MKNKLLKGLIIGLLIGIALGFSITKNYYFPKEKVKEKEIESKVDADLVLEENILGYTAANFQDAILGETTQRKELIVMEQELETVSSLSKQGPWNWQVFSKTKEVKYSGKGVYTIDLNYVQKDTISVDLEKKIVSIKVPHSILQYVNIDYDSIEFQNTEKGLLAFGDISLTVEQQTELEKEVKESMNERLQKEDLLDLADNFAKIKCFEIFQPIVSAISKEFLVEIVFN